MIVICIDDTWFCDGLSRPEYKTPIKDNLYEVIDTRTAMTSNGRKLFYGLQEMPNDCWYDSINFREIDINISDIEVKEEIEELV